MALDPEYLSAIKGFEGYSPNAAWDYKQSSSGYGTKAQAGDEAIPPEQLKAIHEQRYQEEIAKAAAHVDSVNPNLPAGARAALVSLTYNAGPGWAQSGLGEMVRNNDLEGASKRFLEYNKAGGEVNQGLVARRAKEAAWFGGGQPQPAPQAAPAPALAPPAAPLNLAPQQTPPIFAPQPQPQQQAQGGGLLDIPQMQTAPIFMPPRKQIDLSKLRAAFKAPTFGRG
jgi:lysozyme